MTKRYMSVLAAVLLCIAFLGGCTPTAAPVATTAPAAVVTQAPATPAPTQAPVAQIPTPEPVAEAKTPKYIFLFIGDGMSHVQINAAQVLRGNNTQGEIATMPLNFTKFPVAGVVTTHDSTSFCPDSASTATSISSGVKTHSGVVGMEADRVTRTVNIAEQLKAMGMKIGVISSVTINHATPAAFYAHNASRNEYYDIAMQLADSGFDYFAGGAIVNQNGTADAPQQDAFEVIAGKGYKVVNTAADIMALDSSSGKVYAVSPRLQDDGAIPYSMDQTAGDITLAQFVQKGIDVLDNENGFFMMAESGKVDWACHANDAMSAITDVLGFEEAIQVAVDFANAHPDETLILVTGDHETGGMTIGYAATGYNTAFDILSKQKMSYVAFDELMGEMKAADASLTLEDLLPVIKENFGLMTADDPDAADEANAAFVLTAMEYEKLAAGFEESMKASDERTSSEQTALLYGGYDPLSVSLTHIINNKAGIGWTSYAHTGTPVPVFAYGACSELFGGSYDNTDIYHKLVEASGL